MVFLFVCLFVLVLESGQVLTLRIKHLLQRENILILVAAGEKFFSLRGRKT